jgi:hypothetical protein
VRERKNESKGIRKGERKRRDEKGRERERGNEKRVKIKREIGKKK